MKKILILIFTILTIVLISCEHKREKIPFREISSKIDTLDEKESEKFLKILSLNRERFKERKRYSDVDWSNNVSLKDLKIFKEDDSIVAIWNQTKSFYDLEETKQGEASFSLVLGSKIKVKKENGKILLYTLGNAPDLEIEIFKEDLNKGFPEVSYLQ